MKSCLSLIENETFFKKPIKLVIRNKVRALKNIFYFILKLKECLLVNKKLESFVL